MDAIVLFMIAGGCLIVSLLKDKGKTILALKKSFKAFEGILPQFLIVLILVATSLSILDPSTVSLLLGKDSGLLGVAVAAVVGSITLIPPFVAFPAASALLQNGAGVIQIATFVSCLMMVGVVTLPLEIKYFGKRIAIARNVASLLFSFVAAVFVDWMVSL
jgi:uncharacterized membrane protein YraQ (UPF0718 family)